MNLPILGVPREPDNVVLMNSLGRRRKVKKEGRKEGNEVCGVEWRALCLGGVGGEVGLLGGWVIRGATVSVAIVAGVQS